MPAYQVTYMYVIEPPTGVTSLHYHVGLGNKLNYKILYYHQVSILIEPSKAAL